MEKIIIPYGDKQSTILISNNLNSNIADLCMENMNPSRVHIISDDTVAPLYLNKLCAQFRSEERRVGKEC